MNAESPQKDLVAEAQPQTVALFVSDVHLHESLPETTAAFLQFLDNQAKQSNQLYLLGDLFEYWPGDDDIDTPYHRRIIAAIRAVSDAGVAVFWIAGNRDFLVGQTFADATGATLLSDPTTMSIAGQSITLSHGDVLCTDDVEYMAFRTMVRQGAWQKGFLARPLAERKAIIENMRGQSEAGKKNKSADIMDVNAEAVTALFQRTGASILIHGHTHRPASHICQIFNGEAIRHVLPDWDLDHELGARRGGWLAIDSLGMVRRFHV